MQFTKLATWLDAEALNECLARILIPLQRLCLTASAIERKHQLVAQSFTQWVLRHERLELGHQLRVALAGEVTLDPLFEAADTKLFETSDLGLSETVEGELKQWRSSPKRQSVV